MCAELIDDGLVVVQVEPITVEVVVYRGESRVGEDLVLHVANDTRTHIRHAAHRVVGDEGIGGPAKGQPP